MEKDTADKSIASVVVRGRDQSGKIHRLMFNQAAPVPNKRLDYEPLFISGTPPPPRLPVSLPSPGDLVLSLRLGAELGAGGTGLVYEAFVDTEESSPSLASSLPPLAIKFSYRGRAERLAREAYCYNALQPLQGVSAARYYGLFAVHLPHDVQLVQDSEYTESAANIAIAYKKSDEESEEDSDEDSVSGSLDTEHSAEALPDNPALQFSETSYPADTSTKQRLDQHESPLLTDPKIEEVDDLPDTVSILILERLGGHLPIGEPLSKALRKDIRDIYEDFAYMHIYPDDIRYANIMSTPPSPPGLPSLICPIHAKTHKWRLIDFEHAQETNITLEMHRSWTGSWLRRILDNLPDGGYYDQGVW